MKTVLITGAGGALGRSIVKRFLQDGFHVLATIHQEKERGHLPEHPELTVSLVDLSDEEAADAFVERSFARQPLDAALLLAGGYTYGGIADASRKVVEEQLSINFLTAYHIARPLFGKMLERDQGRMVFIGAQTALQANKARTSVAYSLSKSLLFRLSEMLNEEARGTEVVTAVVAPGTIDTEANRQAMPDADRSQWVKPEDIGEALAFLCSDQASKLREPVLKLYGLGA